MVNIHISTSFMVNCIRFREYGGSQLLETITQRVKEMGETFCNNYVQVSILTNEVCNKETNE